MRACYQRIIGRTSNMTSNKNTVKAVLKNIQKQEKDEENPGEKVIRNRKSPEKKRGEPMAPPSMANALSGYGVNDGSLHISHTKNWDEIASGNNDEMNNLWANTRLVTDSAATEGNQKGNTKPVGKRDDSNDNSNNSIADTDNNDHGKKEETSVAKGDDSGIDKVSNAHESSWSPLTAAEMAQVEVSLQALRYGGEMKLSELGKRCIYVVCTHKAVNYHKCDSFCLPYSAKGE